MIKPCPIKMIAIVGDSWKGWHNLIDTETDIPIQGPIQPELSKGLLEVINAWSQRSSQWISVEDRLPTHNYSVLGFVVSGGLADPDPPMIDIVCYLPNKNHWLQFTGKSKDEIVTVTHWQPLPSPPE